MPTIKLTDQLGLDVGAQPAPTSALLKYFQQLPSLRLDSLDLGKLGGLTLDEPAIRSLSTGLSFNEPVTLGDGAPALTIAAGAHGSMQIVRDLDTLPGSDDDPDAPADASYVCLTVATTASATVAATAAGIAFGASPSADVSVASYSRFPNGKGTSLIDAVRQTVGAMIVPLKSEDLDGLAPGQIATVDLFGSLTLSGSADLLATANPLAAASLPAPLPAVSVSAGGSATVGVSFAIHTEYQVVARKLDSGAVRLGWYDKNAESVSVSAKVSEGVSVNVGGADVFAQVIGAISGDAKADVDELSKGGVTSERAAEIQAAVKAAISRKLEIALAAEMSAGESKSAAFLYEIQPGKLTVESRKAVDQALHGDLALLHTGDLPGVATVHSIWENVRKRGIELNVNLLGVLNYGSIARLALSGKVLYEPATGALVITDSATAERIQSTSVNFGADTDKLRHVLAESFLITAAYRGTPAFAAEASLRCSHSFFVLQNRTSSQEMARDLRTGMALGLLSSGDVDLPSAISDFGRTLFTVSTDYDSDLVSRMFVDSSNAPLAHEIYENAGRNAIQFLVQPDDDDAVRRQPATDDTLWGRMKEVGQPGFAALFSGVAAPLVSAIVTDYSTIQWWADAMTSTAQQLANFRLWHARNPAVSPDNPEFQKLRQNLAEHLRGVAATTREEFGAPWGLIAMNQLVGKRAGARMLLAGPRLTLDKRRALAAVTGP